MYKGSCDKTGQLRALVGQCCARDNVVNRTALRQAAATTPYHSSLLLRVLRVRPRPVHLVETQHRSIALLGVLLDCQGWLLSRVRCHVDVSQLLQQSGTASLCRRILSVVRSGYDS